MTEHVLSFPPALEQWVEARIAGGDYVDINDYLRDLIRRDQSRASDDRAWLKAMIDEGVASGLVDGEAEEVLDRIMAEDPDFRD